MRLIAFVLTSLTLTSCASAQSSCSCSDYFENKAKPAWVSNESEDQSHFYTRSSTYCTGLQEVDVKRADKAAKANLVRMVQADVKSTQKLNQGDYGHGTTYSHFTENTTIEANLLLEGSQIYDRWVDTKLCTLFSAVKIGKESVAESIAKKESAENAKLTNQVFSVEPSGNVSVDSKLESILSELKVKTASNDASIIVKSAVFDVQHSSDKLLKLMLSVEVLDTATQRSLWKKTFNGKGGAFEPKSKDYLMNRALRSALKKASKEFKSYIAEGSRA